MYIYIYIYIYHGSIPKPSEKIKASKECNFKTRVIIIIKIETIILLQYELLRPFQEQQADISNNDTFTMKRHAIMIMMTI